MPLRDHFRPPLSNEWGWGTIHAAWAGSLADQLNRTLPEEYRAGELVQAGSLEIDVATWERPDGATLSEPIGNGQAVATVAAPAWAPPVVQATIPLALPADFEVRVFRHFGGRHLVGAIELVSPANKDRPETRLAFATKCASYLYQGVSLIVVDVVTERRANLHNEILGLLRVDPQLQLPDEVLLYATAYRPVRRGDLTQADLWWERLAVGAPLPTLPLRLAGDLFVPVDLEAAYLDACRRRRLG